MSKTSLTLALLGAGAVVYFSQKAELYEQYAQQVRAESTLQPLTRAYNNAQNATSDLALAGGIVLVAGAYAWARARSKP